MVELLALIFFATMSSFGIVSYRNKSLNLFEELKEKSAWGVLIFGLLIPIVAYFEENGVSISYWLNDSIWFIIVLLLWFLVAKVSIVKHKRQNGTAWNAKVVRTRSSSKPSSSPSNNRSRLFLVSILTISLLLLIGLFLKKVSPSESTYSLTRIAGLLLLFCVMLCGTSWVLIMIVERNLPHALYGIASGNIPSASREPQNIEECVADDNLHRALDLLEEQAVEDKDDDKQKTVVLLRMRLVKIEDDYHKGKMTREAYIVERVKIGEAILVISENDMIF